MSFVLCPSSADLTDMHQRKCTNDHRKQYAGDMMTVSVASVVVPIQTVRKQSFKTNYTPPVKVLYWREVLGWAALISQGNRRGLVCRHEQIIIRIWSMKRRWHNAETICGWIALKAVQHRPITRHPTTWFSKPNNPKCSKMFVGF